MQISFLFLQNGIYVNVLKRGNACAMIWHTQVVLMVRYTDSIFFIDHYYAGVSNKHYLLPLFSF